MNPADETRPQGELTPPAVEMVNDLEAAIGAFAMSSPIEPSSEEHPSDTGLDAWNRSSEDAEPDGSTAAGTDAVDDVVPAATTPGAGLAPTAPEGAAPADVVVAEATAEALDAAPPPAPPAPPDPYEQAVEAAARGERARAVAELRALLASSPEHEAARLALAKLLTEAGELNAALAVLDEGLERASDSVPLLIGRAHLHLTGMRLENADADLRRAIKLDEEQPDALLLLGLAAMKRGRWREAVDPLRRAADLAPDRAAAHYYLGEALNRIDRLPEALSAYETAAALDPDNWRAHKGVGIVLDRLRRPQDAAEAYRRARETHRP